MFCLVAQGESDKGVEAELLLVAKRIDKPHMMIFLHLEPVGHTRPSDIYGGVNLPWRLQLARANSTLRFSLDIQMAFGFSRRLALLGIKDVTCRDILSSGFHPLDSNIVSCATNGHLPV